MKALITTLLLCFSTVTFGAVVASMPNQAGGKIVLTDEECRHKGKTYTNLYKAYFYTPEGITGDGCWALEDETVVVVWIDSGNTRRYPAQNFDVRPRGRNL
jgi:hypothetical protein